MQFSRKNQERLLNYAVWRLILLKHILFSNTTCWNPRKVLAKCFKQTRFSLRSSADLESSEHYLLRKRSRSNHDFKKGNIILAYESIKDLKWFLIAFCRAGYHSRSICRQLTDAVPIFRHHRWTIRRWFRRRRSAHRGRGAIHRSHRVHRLRSAGTSEKRIVVGAGVATRGLW